MPKFTLPKTQPSDESVPAIPGAVLFLPADKEIIEELEVDQPVELLIKAKVKGLESRETNSNADRYEFSIELQSYEVRGENEFEKMSREDESGG